ncbi:MAG: helix-turn-helix domain-containing protein [Lachnospiraceae bacterium]|nr:helix-turn-helix domain-containing protein [Lachnospiraceae bacterium]
MELVKVLSNPVKCRILQYMQSRESATTKQIASELSDIPTATLYRHVNALVKAHFLVVKKENRIRGSVERILALNTETMVSVQNDDLAKVSYEFLMSLYAQFEAYAGQEDCDPVRDMLTMRTFMISLSDKDFSSLLEEMGALFKKYQEMEDKENGKLRSISTISAPVGEAIEV